MTKKEKAILRSDIFRHLDGIVTAPTAYALHKAGVLDYILQEKSVMLAELTDKFEANEGNLNIALHTMAAQSWLQHEILAEDKIKISITDHSRIAFAYIPLYADVVQLMALSGKYHPRKFEMEPFTHLERIFQKFKNNYGLSTSKEENELVIQNQILKHIEGNMLGPTLVAFGMSGMFHKYFMEASFRPDEFHADGDSFGRLLDIFVYFGYFMKKKDTYEFTEKGLFYARRASAYGVTVSYIPTFRHMDDLLFGDPNVIWQSSTDGKEIHVDREMNVWGSGGAHSAYFKVMDQVIIELFNRPIDQQPKGILDMGCGNGAFLIHLYDVISQRTLRGTMLEEHPLFLIGADYNEAALKVTRANIIQADIWAKLIWGDIGQPELLASQLKDKYGIALKDLLNVRTFLDHNRIWSDPVNKVTNQSSESAGAFSYRGQRLSNAIVESNLREHLSKWMPYVAQFGLLVIELHTISPTLIADNLGKTPATAYNATHGFSDQYIVEIDTFLKVAAQAGLIADKQHYQKFPNSELATVSINLLKASLT